MYLTLRKIYQNLFCRHNFVDCCSITDNIQKTHDKDINYQDLCSTRKKLGHCKKHDENYNVIPMLGMCDQYYRKCTKCGKVEYD